MASKKPQFPKLTYSMREVLEPGTPVGAVHSGLGRIHIAGASLFRIMPGGWGLEVRALPDQLGFPFSIAVEPRPPYRVAIGADSGDVVIFTDTSTASSITRHPFTEQLGSKDALQLAWVEHDGQSSLFARTDDGMLYIMQSEGWGSLDLPPVRAIAQDGAHGIAALTVIDGEPKVYTNYDGTPAWQVRTLGVEVEAEPDAPAYLALASEAVVAVVGESGPLISREAGQTTRYPTFSRASAVAFEGSAADSRVYVSLRRTEDEPAAVWMITADGVAGRAMNFMAEDHEPLDLLPIVWDDARKALLVPTRLGLLAMGPEEPKPKRARARKQLTQ